MKTTDYVEYGNGRKVYFNQDGTAFEFDYDGGDAQEDDDITNAITFIPGGTIRGIGKAIIKDIVKDAGKDAIKRVGKPDIGRKLEYIFGNATGAKHNIERSY